MREHSKNSPQFFFSFKFLHLSLNLYLNFFLLANGIRQIPKKKSFCDNNLVTSIVSFTSNFYILHILIPDDIQMWKWQDVVSWLKKLKEVFSVCRYTNHDKHSVECCFETPTSLTYLPKVYVIIFIDTVNILIFNL